MRTSRCGRLANDGGRHAAGSVVQKADLTKPLADRLSLGAGEPGVGLGRQVVAQAEAGQGALRARGRYDEPEEPTE